MDSLENFVAKMPTLRRQNLIQNTLSAVSSAGTSGYSSEVAEVKEDEASPGQEAEVMRLESQSSDTTLVPEDRGRSSRQGREEGRSQGRRQGREEGRRPRQRSHNRRSQEWGRMLDLERRARSGDRGAKGDTKGNTKGDTKGVREPRSRSRSREADRQASFSPTFMENMARSLDRNDSEAEVTQL